MKSLRSIIVNEYENNSELTRDELFEAVIAAVVKEGFYTDEELSAIEDELTDRLRNY